MDEVSLANAYAVVSDGVLPLSSSGEVLWPQVGDEATILFTNASCLSEVVARVPRERTVVVRGQVPQPVARKSTFGGGSRSMSLPV